jgi:cupin fold WbuC family metalloprotein
MQTPTRTLSPEVLVADAPVVCVSREDVEFLKQQAQRTDRLRSRLCAHMDVEDGLHEMLIVHSLGAYVRPHKHIGKSESLHVLEGEVDLVLFSEDGVINQIVPMGDYGSGRTVYCRLAGGYHTLLIRSDIFVFHETTNGPFNRQDTIFAPWAPAEEDAAAVADYVQQLQQVVTRQSCEDGQ